MAQAKTVQVPILGGMREDISPHMAPPGTLVNAENVRFPVGGEVESRRGTTVLSVATSANVSYDDVINNDGPDFLEAVPGGFVFGAQGYGFRYDATKGRVHACGSYANALPQGRFAAIASEEAVYTIGKNLPYPVSTAVGGGYVAICWSAGNGQQGGIGPLSSGTAVKVQIYTESGTLVTTYTDVIATSSAAWVLYDATTAKFILIVQNATTDLSAATITLASGGPTVGAFVSVGTLTAATANWAVCAWPGIGWAIVYQSGATTATIKAISGTTVATTQTFTTTAIQPLSVYGDTTNLYVGYVDVGGGGDCRAKMRAYSTTLVLASGGDITLYTDAGQASLTLTPPLFGTTVASAPRAYFVIGRTLGVTSDTTTLGTWLVSGIVQPTGAFTIGDPVYGALPSSAPFNSGMVWARMRSANALAHGNDFVRHVLLDFQADRITTADTSILFKKPRIALIGDAFSDLLSGDYRGGSYLLQLGVPVQLSSGNWIVGIARLVRSETLGGTSWGLALAEWLQFKTDAPRQVRQFGVGEVVVPGSPVLVGSDSVGTFHYGITPTTENQGQGMDLGFFVEPPATVTSVDTVGSLTLLGFYQYRSTLEWIDILGRRWRSRPSRVYTVQLAGAQNTVNHLCPDTALYMRQFFSALNPSGVVRHIYRTTAGGSTFYRITPPQGTKLASGNVSDQFVDTMSDTDAASREILYTDGGVLPNDHPPSCRFAAIMEDRIWLGGLWAGNEIQSSKILVPGEPPQFSDSPAFRVVLPNACTGMAAQDGILIAFTQNAIYAVSGFGPNDQGQGEWGTPRVITRSTGCINELSILETSAGIFFQSYRGIELLPRGLGEPQFIGAPVQNTLGTSLVLSCAVIRGASGTTRTARFCIGANVILVFDLDSGAWSRDTYPLNISAICDTDTGAVLAWKDVSGGFGFYLENSSALADNITPIASVLEWAAVRPFGVAGQGRFTGAVGMFDELVTASSAGYQTANATLFVTVDGATELGKAYDMGVMSAPAYRKRSPLQDVGSACVLKMTAAANGWRFMGWTLELDDSGGSRRMAETEQG